MREKRVLLLALSSAVALLGLATGARTPALAGAADSSPRVMLFHGGSYDRAGALTVDGTGNLYVAGSVEGENFETYLAAVKYAPDGRELWRARHVEPAGGKGDAIAVDAAGNVYVAGF